MEIMESSERQNTKEGNEVKDDFDSAYPQEGDEDMDEDIDDEKFCSKFLKPQSKEILGGINLKDLCEGKEVMFEMNDKFLDADEEQFNEQGDDEQNHGDEETMAVDSSHKGDTEKHNGKETSFYLNESFESIVSGMTSITDDDCIKKKEIVGGIGEVIPENSYVIVHYNLFKETSEAPFDSTYLRKRPERIDLGQGNLIPGLEIAIKTMKKKEKSRFFIQWDYAFGALGCPDRIEPKCDIIADIELINFEEIDLPELGDENGSWFERGVLQIKAEQTAASEYFKEGKTKLALSRYKKSVKMINNLSITSDKEETIYRELKVKSLVNLAICYNKLGQHELACVMCQEALSISPRNKKALFHYARASIALSNFSKARTLLTKLHKMNPNNQDVVAELRKLELKKELYNMTTQDFWRKAFNLDPKKKEPEADTQGSNPRSKNSNGGNKKGCRGSTKKNQGYGQEEEISRRFEENLNLNSEAECVENWD